MFVAAKRGPYTLVLMGMMVSNAQKRLAMLRGKWQRAPRRRRGVLHCGEQAAALEVLLGAFRVYWAPGRGGQMVVEHSAHPDTPLWATRRGESFVCAGLGRQQVHESRGHVFVNDQVERLWLDQRVEQVWADGAALHLAGMLLDGQGHGAAYWMTLRSLDRHTLAFEVRVDMPLNRIWLTFEAWPGEQFAGFGVQYSRIMMRGRRVPIVPGEQGIGRGLQPLTLGADLQAGAGGAWHSTYAPAPMFLSSHGRSFWLETYEYAVFDLRGSQVQIELHGAELRARLAAGADPAMLLEHYTAANGRMPLLPDWVHEGVVVGLQGGSAVVRQRYAMLCAAGVPVAAIWIQDWCGRRATSFGSQVWWNWQLDRALYPDWEALHAELAGHGVRLLTYVNPALTPDTRPNRRNLFAEAVERGFLVQRPGGAPYQSRITDFEAALVDLTNPSAYAWLRDRIVDHARATGSSGWMADFGESLPFDAVLWSGEPAARVRQHYPELWAALNREAAEQVGVLPEPLFFVRAGYRASPGAAALFWLGDQLVSWDAHDGIKSAVTGLLSGGLSGFSLNHSDTGGYTAIVSPLARFVRSKELVLRWMELSALTVLFRTHEGNRPASNWQVYSDDETLAQLRRCGAIFRAWGFYRRQLVREAAERGLPVARHMLLVFPDDPRAWRIRYEQYMLGEELLVVPVLDPGARAVRVYLPEGRWVHVWTGRHYLAARRGARTSIAAPIGRPAVFYRAGSPVGEQFRANLLRELGEGSQAPS